jgi:fermentation-respiration switch protein FrsA (DUF1100 family)
VEAQGTRRLPRLARQLIVGALLVVLGMLGLGPLERALIYFPDRRPGGRPVDYGLAAEEVSPRAGDGVRLHGWWLHGEGTRALVWFHGNAGNAGHRLERARRFVAELGLDVALVDYRGYGQSGGVPGESGLYLDGRAVYEVATGRGFAPEQIILLGESLGAAVAVDVGAERAVGAVVLEAPFASLRALARAHYPLVPPFLVRSRFDNAAKIGRVAAPKLFLQAERDEVVPPAQTRRLYDLAPAPKTYVVVPGATHNTIWRQGDPTALEAWRRFLDDAR